MKTTAEVEGLALAIPEEERPVPPSKLAGFGSFLGIYGGEHIAATEFVIGAFRPLAFGLTLMYFVFSGIGRCLNIQKGKI